MTVDGTSHGALRPILPCTLLCEYESCRVRYYLGRCLAQHDCSQRISCPTHLTAQEVSCTPRYSGAIPVKWYLLQHTLAKGLYYYYKYFQALQNRGTHASTRLWHSRVVKNTNLTIGGSLAGTTPVLPSEVLFSCAGSFGTREDLAAHWFDS